MRTIRTLIAKFQPLACMLLLVMPVLVSARPYTPATDATVLERLPVSLSGAARELAHLRAQWQAAPNDEAAALVLAERYIALGRAETDPRFYGQAEGVLQRVWRDHAPSARALVLRAIVLQARHDFSAALADLEIALTGEPRNAQAWLTQAAILRVQGEYAAATQSCGRLARLVEPLVFSTCLASVRALDGHAVAAFDLLERALTATPSVEPGVQQWALTTVAEIAVGRGLDGPTEQYFQAALALPVRSIYTLLAYADFLLDHGRAAAVLSLLASETRVDGALLRLTLAAQVANDQRLAGYRSELAGRMVAARQRGDTLHQGDAARYALYVENNPAGALALAIENWRRQREPRDARIVLEAAQARGQLAAAQPVIDFLHARNTEDVVLTRLMPTTVARP